ncbi:MAG: hypothetical protein JWR63_4601 [Conexibacter sp.]|nr:hypothetical protein [Conexibacter sp.]
MAVLHVTNGSAAAADLRGLGEVLGWDDVLHEGPVPALEPAALREVRARFLGRAGLIDAPEALARLTVRDGRLDAVDFSTRLVLWFEDDLYDQLQLVQVLDRLAASAESRRSRPLGPVQLVRLPRGPRIFLRDKLAAGASLGEAEHDLARRVWAAFTSTHPDRVQDAWLAGTPGLPDLAPALGRLLEEHPATTDGLGRTERQIVDALAAGPLAPAALFMAATAHEDRPFHGDATLWWRASSLAPLVVRDDAGRFALSDDGAAVHAGAADALALLAPLDRWVGGVHHRGAPAVRWDPATRRLAP